MSAGNGQQEQLVKIEQRVAADVAAGASPDSFVQQVNRAIEILGRTGVWLGKLGAHDAKEIQAFAEHLRQESQQFIADLIARKRQELAELERTMGRLK